MSARTEAVAVSRDPFARQTFMRLAGDKVAGGCAWCGNLEARFYYYVEDDSGRRAIATYAESRRRYCNVACFRAFGG